MGRGVSSSSNSHSTCNCHAHNCQPHNVLLHCIPLPFTGRLVVVVPPPPSATPLDPYLTLSRPTQTIGRPSSSRRLSFSCILSQTLFSVDSTHLKTVNCSMSLAAAIQLLIPEPLQIASNIPDNCFRSKSQTH